jgi:hypothetical protein
VWAAGNDGSILHSTGNGGWKTAGSAGATQYAIWGSSSTNVWSVGQFGTIDRTKDGTTWNPETSGTGQGLLAIWGTPDGANVWAVGSNGTLIYSTGNGTWTSVASSVTGGVTDELDGIFGTSATDVYFVGLSEILHLDSTGAITPQTIPSGTIGLASVWGSGPNDLYAAGPSTMLHSAGTGTWVAQTVPTGSLHAVWGSGPSDVWAAGTQILHSTGDGTWTAQPLPAPGVINAIWGTAPTNVYLLGSGNSNAAEGLILHYY